MLDLYIINHHNRLYWNTQGTNDIYPPIDDNGFENFSSKIEIDGKSVIYNDTDYSKYDDFLCSLDKEKMKILSN